MEMPKGGYTETIARPDLMDLHSKDFVQIAELAGRVVRKAHCRTYGFVRTVGDLVDEVRELIDEGNRDQARKLAEQLLTLAHEFLQKLVGRETEPPTATCFPSEGHAVIHPTGGPLSVAQTRPRSATGPALSVHLGLAGQQHVGDRRRGVSRLQDDLLCGLVYEHRQPSHHAPPGFLSGTCKPAGPRTVDDIHERAGASCPQRCEDIRDMGRQSRHDEVNG